ncbi:MAG: outer membrane beta-barrel protein [Muribaculaceae bacterium]|nr:outer membrane beta-barrel protein [Muribaculaceae bacterium]
MNRFYTIILLFLLLSFNMSGQEISDSIESQQLNEVVVKASRRIIRGDTLCVIPSSSQRKFNVTGYELLRSMMLPGLRVNTITGELTTNDGQKAVVLIDGRPVDRQDILAIQPKNVARIEYLQTPGTEYGYDTSIGAVINVVLKQRTDGYTIGAIANNAVTTANGENFVVGKYTRKNSEYTMSVNSDYTSLSKRRINDTDIYMIGDQPHQINRQGINTPLKYTQNTMQATYNHFLPGKQIFDVNLRGVIYHSPDRAHRQFVTEDGAKPYFQLTEPYEKYISPRLSLYYKRFINATSAVTANVVGVYRHTDYRYEMSESESEDFQQPSYHYAYGTKSNRQAYIGEIKYYTRFNRKLSISTGTRVSHSYTSNEYSGENKNSDKLHDTNIYAYVSAYGYLGKFYYLAGAGVSGRLTSQNDHRMNKWMFRPELHLIYRTAGWRFNLYNVILQNSPSLSQMAATEFQNNRFEITRGNPDLKNWWKYRLAFKINGNLGPIGVQNTLTYVNEHNPVMSSVERTETDGDTRFISTFENQKRMSLLSNSFSLNLSFGENLNLSAGIDFKSYQSRGHGYSHNLDHWQFNVAADWSAGNWNAGINWRNKERSLSGESYLTTGAYNNVYINYSLDKHWRFGLIGQHLFCKNGPEFNENLHNKYLIKKQSVLVPAQRNMIMLSVSWFFSAGKQRKEATIDMTNDDNESGILK